MENVLKGTSFRVCIVGKINGLAVEAKKARRSLLKSKSVEKVWSCANTKRFIGEDIRHHLLAYAFLRGTAYNELERKCREDHLPSSESILKIVQGHVAVYKAPAYTIDKVNAWLKGEV
jgi:hypothetical protein